MPMSAIPGKASVGLVLRRLHVTEFLPQIVDIGPGIGTYARLLQPLLPGARWTGIEIWAPYVRDYKLVDIYDQIYIADVTCFDLQLLSNGGVAILGDVLEHMTKDIAARTAARLLQKVDYAVLSIPIGIWEQGAAGGNPFEAHVASWSIDDVPRYFPHLAGVSEHVLSQGEVQHSIAVAYLARTPTMRRKLACLVEATNGALRDDALLATCGGQPFGPAYREPTVIDTMVSAILAGDAALQGRVEPTVAIGS